MTQTALYGVLGQIRSLVPPAEVGTLSDRELLARFTARRDEGAFNALVRRYGPLVWSVCRHVLGKHHDAEDAFQAAFLVLSRNATSVRSAESLASYLHGVAYRVAMTAKRQAARRRAREDRAAATARGGSVSETAWNRLQAALDEEVQRLPERLRAAFVLCHFHGKGHAEAAAELGCQAGTVASRLAQARQKLLDRLARRGVSLSAVLCAGVLARQARAVPAGLVTQATAAALTAPRKLAAPLRTLTRGTSCMTLAKSKLAALLLAAALVGGAGAWFHRPFVPPSDTDNAPTALSRASPSKSADALGGASAPEVTLSGQVLAPDQTPLSNARVYFLRMTEDQDNFASGAGSPRRIERETGTDSAGRFRLRLAAPKGADGKRAWGDAVLTAVAPGYGPGWAFVGARQPPGGLKLRLVPDDIPVHGRVLDLEGRPIAGVTVRVVAIRAVVNEDLKAWLAQMRAGNLGGMYLYTLLDAAARRLRPATSGADGRFRIAGAGRDRVVALRFSGPTIETRDVYAMTREEPAYARRRSGSGLGGGQAVFHGATFDHVAAPPRPIFGTVRGRDTGEVLGGVSVHAPIPWGLAPAGENEISATTDRGGRYRLTGIGRASDRVTVSPPAGSPYLPVMLKVPDGTNDEPTRLDIGLDRPVKGRGGKPIAQPADPGRSASRAWIARNGHEEQDDYNEW